jgi:hypothetical protein
MPRVAESRKDQAACFLVYSGLIDGGDLSVGGSTIRDMTSTRSYRYLEASGSIPTAGPDIDEARAKSGRSGSSRVTTEARRLHRWLTGKESDD